MTVAGGAELEMILITANVGIALTIYRVLKADVSGAVTRICRSADR